LGAYFVHYGHQIYTLDFAEPTLEDDPLPVLLSLKAMVARPGQGALARQAEMARERDRLVAALEHGLDPLRRSLFRRVLRWAQRLAPGRDEAFFYVGAAWPTLRRLALELGRRLANAGFLAAADDIFFLESAEIVDASGARVAGEDRRQLAAEARARRELREARKRLYPPAAVPPDYRYRIGPFDLSGFETQRRNLLEGPTLRGFAVSPGRVTAPASVIRSPADFGTMEPGTILVCPTTTPAWTPLFAQARGLITDIGGVLAHGSIVAREYGIPAVMGTGNATQRIASGQVVTVDGDVGTVTLTV
jgi:pyruvate,water dikinase